MNDDLARPISLLYQLSHTLALETSQESTPPRYSYNFAQQCDISLAHCTDIRTALN